MERLGRRRSTTRRCGPPPTRWSRAAWRRTAISSSTSTTGGKERATANGVLQPNEKFPDMKALADYVHAKAEDRHLLVAGQDDLPGAAGQLLARGDRRADVGRWGFDLLKHDWCSYEHDRERQQLADLKKPYIVMRDALPQGRPRHRLQPVPVRHGQRVGVGRGGRRQLLAHERRSHRRVVEHVGGRLPPGGREKWSKPRATGPIPTCSSSARSAGAEHPRHAADAERADHDITLWALQAAPLLIGADMAQFDPFTTALMTNHEVLEVNQECSRRRLTIYQRERLELWARPLADGTIAVGLFNRCCSAVKMTATWKEPRISPASARARPVAAPRP